MNLLSVRAVGSLWTPSCNVVLTDHLSSMFVPAIWSMLTESSGVPRAILDLALWINVKVLVSMTYKTDVRIDSQQSHGL